MSGDQDGPAGQSPGDGFVMDGGQAGQRPAPGDVDLQVAGVGAGDELGTLGGVAAREHGHHPNPAPGVVQVGECGADEGSAAGQAPVPSSEQEQARSGRGFGDVGEE